MEISKVDVGGEEVVAIRLAHREGGVQEYAARLIGPDLGNGLRREYAEPLPGSELSPRRGMSVYAVKVSDLPALLELREPVGGIHSRPDIPFHVFVMPDGSYENVPFLEIAHYLPKEYRGRGVRVAKVGGLTVPLPVEEMDRSVGRGS